MDCDEIEMQLFEFATDRLNEEDRRSVEVHLNSCDFCKKKLSIIKETLPLLDYWSPPEMPADFADSVIEKIKIQEEPLWRRVVNKLFFPLHIKIPLEGLAATAVLLLIFIAYKTGYISPWERIERTAPVTITTLDAKHPIVIVTDNVEANFNKLLVISKAYNGHLVRRQPMERGIKVAIKVPAQEENLFINEISKIGRVTIPVDGYKDGEGNIIIISKK